MMSFYNLKKEERLKLVERIYKDIFLSLQRNNLSVFRQFFSDEDTYIRKTAYTATGRIFNENKNLQKKIVSTLKKLLEEEDFKIRQTAINAAGEIGIRNFEIVEDFFRCYFAFFFYNSLSKPNPIKV